MLSTDLTYSSGDSNTEADYAVGNIRKWPCLRLKIDFAVLSKDLNRRDE